MPLKETTEIHDFYKKLCQKSVHNKFLKYIEYQRKVQNNKLSRIEKIESLTVPFSITSINLDLTTACNHSCLFCIDHKVTNKGKKLKFEDIINSIITLKNNGLKSVILIGGGEPTLHPDFVDIVKFIKDKNLQLGISTNGTRIDKILSIIPFLKMSDYIRFSIDAGTDATYQVLHSPPKKQTLFDILNLARKIKHFNSSVSIGYSFVICWDNITINGNQIQSNMKEIPQAYQNCIDYSFDYLSLKPCLTKSISNPVESIYISPNDDFSHISQEIKRNIKIAEENNIKNKPIIQSINLKYMLANEISTLQTQPQICHIGFFRQVINPIGIYHCPAFRGSQIALIKDSLGYSSNQSIKQTYQSTTELLLNFNANISCKDIACFYNGFNWSIQKLIDSNINLDELNIYPDNDFFL